MTATHDSILKVNRRGRLCDSAEQRSALVEAYPSSGLSGPRFAALHGMADHMTEGRFFCHDFPWHQSLREALSSLAAAGPPTSEFPFSLVVLDPVASLRPSHALDRTCHRRRLPRRSRENPLGRRQPALGRGELEAFRILTHRPRPDFPALCGCPVRGR